MSTNLNILTVDLEEWFVVEVLSDRYRFDEWNELPSTVVKNCHRLLELFRRKEVRATWFVLGWIADYYPDLIREIASYGHEIGCHSYRHIRVDSLSPEQFREDTKRAMEAITRAINVHPVGYRAPSWSISSKTPWAFEILAELGFSYDSSIFPIKHDLYGMPKGPRKMFKMTFENGRSLYEIPSSTWRIMGHNIPVSGGGYLRHSPYWYIRMMIKRLNKNDLPVMIYLHPWEIDPDLPRVEGLTTMQKFRTYGSTSLFRYKLERLLDDFAFICAADYISVKTKRKIGFERAD